MKSVPIEALVEPVLQAKPLENGREWIVYVDISSIDSLGKCISSPSRIRAEAAPSRARQILAAEDCLVSTVRPALNAVALVPSDFAGEFASTGFCVLRPDRSEVVPSYLHFFTRTIRFISQLSRNAVGASYPAVTDADILKLNIPLPTLDAQASIAQTLDRADRLRRLAAYSLGEIESLPQSTFIRWFGRDEKLSSVSTVEELAEPRPNSIRTGPFGSQLLHSEFTNRGIAVLGIDNAVNNCFEWARRRFISNSKYERLKRYTVFPGDVLITIMATCGRCAVVPDNVGTAINTKHLCCISLDTNRCLPEYLRAAFLFHPFVRQQLLAATKGSIMDGLNMEIIKALAIPIPPLPVQAKYVNMHHRCERLSATRAETVRQAEHLFRSAVNRAYDSN